MIDYAIYSEPLLLNITDFNIEERTESQHFPVYISILSSVESPNVHHTNKNHKTERRCYRFNDKNTEVYKNNLRTLLTPDFMLSFIQSIQDNSVDISVVLDKFLEIFYKCGSMCTSVKKRVSKEHSKWFDEGCKKLEQEKVRLLRQFRRLRTPENLNIYKWSRQTFKSHCNAKSQYITLMCLTI